MVEDDRTDMQGICLNKMVAVSDLRLSHKLLLYSECSRVQQIFLMQNDVPHVTHEN